MTLDSLSVGGGPALVDSCRTAQYDTAAAFVAAANAGDYVPSPILMGRFDCPCSDCPPAASEWPYDPAQTAPWVAADRPDSYELWDIRTHAWERQSPLLEADEGCEPGSWRWEVELVGSPAGRRFGVTWLAQQLHATAACRAGTCRGCGANDLEIVEDCGPTLTIRDAKPVVFRDLVDEQTECVTRVEVLWEAADSRRWMAPTLVESWDPDDWGAVECSPLHPLNVDCDCPGTVCDPVFTPWAELSPGIIVTSGEGDESVLTRAIQSPDQSAYFDLTAVGLQAPFRSVNVYDVTGGNVIAAPSGVTWTVSPAHPANPTNTATVDVTGADGVSARVRIGLLAVFCSDPHVGRPAMGSIDTVRRPPALTQPLPGYDPTPDRFADPGNPSGGKPLTDAFPLPGPDLTPAAWPPIPDTFPAPAAPVSASNMTTGSVVAQRIGNPVTSGTISRGGTFVGWQVLVRNTGTQNALTGAKLRVWLPQSAIVATWTATSSAPAGGTVGAAVDTGWYVEVDVTSLAAGGIEYAELLLEDPIHDGTETPMGSITAELFPAGAGSSLSNTDSDTSPGPVLIPLEGEGTGVINAQLYNGAAVITPGATVPLLAEAYIGNGSPAVKPSDDAIGIIGAQVVIPRPPQILSWTVTAYDVFGATHGSINYHTNQTVITNVTLDKDSVLDVVITNAVHDGSDNDVDAITFELSRQVSSISNLGGTYTDSCPGPALVVTPDVVANVAASLNPDTPTVPRGETIVDPWTIYVDNVSAPGGQLTGARVRVAMPDGISAWQWQVQGVGLTTYTDSSPTGGAPWIDLTDVTIGQPAGNRLVIEITSATHDDSLSDVGPLNVEVSAGLFSSLSDTVTGSAPGPLLAPCPPSRWYEDDEFVHATVAADADGKAWWTWDGAVGPITATATGAGVLGIQGAGFVWSALTGDVTSVVECHDQSGRHAVVSITPGPNTAVDVDCETLIAPPVPVRSGCGDWCEPFMRRTLFFTVAAESTDIAALLRLTADTTPLRSIGLRWWTNPAACPPENEACPPADGLVPVDLPGYSVLTLGPDRLERVNFDLTSCPTEAARGLPELPAGCGPVCVSLTVDGTTSTPPPLVELLTQEWSE